MKDYACLNCCVKGYACLDSCVKGYACLDCCGVNGYACLDCCMKSYACLDFLMMGNNKFMFYNTGSNILCCRRVVGNYR